jgi:hypothetical protein
MNSLIATILLAGALASPGAGRAGVSQPGFGPPAAPAKPAAGAVVPGAPTQDAPLPTPEPYGEVGGYTSPAPGTSLTESLTGAQPGGDTGMLLLLFAAVFAAIGFFRGSRREIPALVATVVAYFVISGGWGLIARFVNLGWRMFHFAVLRRGIMADNPGQAWTEASGLDPLLPAEGAGLRLAQMLLFAISLVVIYAATRAHSEPNLIERLIGALTGAVTGYVVGVFMLGRIMPQAKLNLRAPGAVALGWIEMLGPVAALILVGAVIILGWRALGPRGFTKRYG